MSKKQARESDAFRARSAGMLLHITSLPGPHGSGDLGGVQPLLDFAQRAGLRWWQVLPIHPPDGFASPYQTSSSFAGHPGLIDLASLVRAKLLPKSAVTRAALDSGAQCDFAASQTLRERLLRRAFEKFDAAPPRELARFKKQHKNWLADWALFEALTREANGANWQDWSPELRDRQPTALVRARRRLAREIRYHVFLQFMFDANWREFRTRAASSNVKLLGDLAKFVAPSSADAWSHPNLFCLDKRGRIDLEAGTPPDAFTRYGQRWGVPTYRVAEHRRTGYSWWIARVRRELELFDGLRLDHFIGFARTFSIPRADRSQGRYTPGLGRGLFEALTAELGPLPFVVEDLGDAGPDVDRLRNRFGFPGMKVLQFGLDGLDGGNPYLPHNWQPETVAYSGTHDNPTSVAWFKAHAARPGSRSKPGVQRREILEYTGGQASKLHEEIIRVLWTSVAKTVIVPAQDLLGLGSEARMNIPGRAGGNWGWRLSAGELTDAVSDRLFSLSRMTGRIQ